jgi:iron(III) transport system permease protein
MNARALVAPRWFGLAAWLTPVIFFAIAPVALLVARSLRTLDTAVAIALLSELDALGNTLMISGGAAALAFLLGTPLALLLFRTDVPLRGAFTALFTLPSAIPPFIWGMGWLSLANPKAGYLNRLFGEDTFDIYGPAGIAFVLGLSGLPLVLLAGASALRRIDPGLEEAARVCGASPARALLATTIPLALPSLLSGAVMVFLMSASAFGVPYILGVSASPPTRVLTTRIYGYVLMGGEDNLARAVLLATTLLAMTPLVLWLNRVFGKLGRVRLGAGKGVSPRPMALGRARVPALLFVATSAFVLVLLPLGSVGLTSMQRSFGAELTAANFTLAHWAHLFGDARTLHAAGRSLLLALGAGAVVVVLGLAAALLRRRLNRIGHGVEALSVWPYAVPGTVLAIALLVAFSRDLRFIAFERVAFVLALAHSSWLLLIAYAAKYLALGAKNSDEALAQSDPSLAEAARVSGAGPARAFFDAVLPLLRPALFAAFVLTFLVCATEITMSVLLVPAGTDVLGTLLFELQSYADPSAASVLACAFVLLVLLGQAALAAARRPGGAR